MIFDKMLVVDNAPS